MESFNGQLLTQVSKRLAIPSGETITKINESISPVFQINEKPLLKSGTFSSTGNTYSFTCPTDKIIKIVSIQCTWTATATVGNRVINFTQRQIAGSATGFWFLGATNNQTAGTTVSYYFAPYVTPITTSGKETFCLPDMGYMLPGSVLYFSDAGNIDVADTMTLRMVWTEESSIS